MINYYITKHSSREDEYRELELNLEIYPKIFASIVADEGYFYLDTYIVFSF